MTEQQIERMVKDKIRTEVGKIKRKWALIGAGVVAVIPLTLWAASITKPHTFADGDTLSAAKLNENFDTLYTKFNSLDSRFEQRIGTYCGQTALTYTGSAVGGYTGAKSLCQTACSNTNAHLCSSHELLMSWQLGIAVPTALFYGGAHSADLNNISQGTTDCDGFTSASASIFIPTTSTNTPAVSACNIARSLACCL